MRRSSSQPTRLTNKADRAKMLRSVGQTVTVVPSQVGPEFEMKRILDAVGPRHALVIHDEDKDTYWVRGLDIGKEDLKLRLNSQSSGNFLCREVGEDAQDKEETNRLMRELTRHLRNETLGRFNDLPFEIMERVLKACFEGLSSPEAYVKMLHKLYWLGRRSRDVINSLPELWTKIHPTSPSGFTEYSLQQATAYHISVYYSPKPNRSIEPSSPEEQWQDFHKFLRLIKPQRAQWERMDMEVTPESLASLTTALESPSPNLRSLFVTVTAAPWSNSLALPMVPSLRAQVNRRLNLLGGEQKRLQHLGLKNVPGRFDPTAFPGLVSLSLADGTRMRYTEITAFLGSSTSLRALSLVNIRWLDHLPAPTVSDEGLFLPQLKDLTLVEFLEHTGLTNLLYLIDIRACDKLHLRTLATVELLGQRLAQKVVPIVEKTLATQPRTSLDIRHHSTSGEMSWEGRKTSQDLNGEEKMGFHIGFSSSNPRRWDQLGTFVKRVLDLTGQTNSISLDWNGPYWLRTGPIMAVPILSAEILRQLDITNVSANVAEGYLGYVKDFLIDDLEPRFPHLSSVQLRYIPDSQAIIQHCAWAQHTLESLLNNLDQVYGQTTVEGDLFEEASMIISVFKP
ncbi:hypothetical protein FRC00_001809 [Tulasnella sp. 408]|nr:hypothetical protein FRC00_001809 [Tulasnella sp. 408]